MNEAKDIDGLPITFTGQAHNHHSKEPSLNGPYAFPREPSTWLVLGFLPPLPVVKTVSLTCDMVVKLPCECTFADFAANSGLQIATKTEAMTNISRMAKPRACFWMQAAAS